MSTETIQALFHYGVHTESVDTPSSVEYLGPPITTVEQLVPSSPTGLLHARAFLLSPLDSFRERV